jgi:hypothetical protein
VAVVQISRIQIRRGQKNTGTGLPQLASGELGWAIDTRELYIGNGSVAEGAPAVGNTKILTEFDDIFSFSKNYSYKLDNPYIQTGTDSSNPVFRTLQSRLDDAVSAASFGAIGNGIEDDTTALQQAIDQLYLNTTENEKPILYLDAGTYIISNTLYVPSRILLRGSGIDNTVIRQTADAPILKTVNESSLPGSPAESSTSTSLNQPKFIQIENLTLEQTQPNLGILLENCKDSAFYNLRIIGSWQGDFTENSDNTGIKVVSLSEAVSTEKNIFQNCIVKNFEYGVTSSTPIKHVTFSNCEFSNLGIAFKLDHSNAVNNLIEDCLIQNILRYGIWIANGYYNLSKNNRFLLVGVDDGLESNPVYPVIWFANSPNKSESDYFARTEVLISGQATESSPYIPEIFGDVSYELSYEHRQEFGALNDNRLFRLPGLENQVFFIEYSISSLEYNTFRSGTMQISVNKIDDNIEIIDNYSFIGDSDYEDGYTFRAITRNLREETNVPETIDILVTSLMPQNDQSVIKFNLSTQNIKIS